MLPVVAGRAATTLQILVYSAVLFPISLLPWALGFAGSIYGATALLGGALFVVLAFQLRGTGEADRRASHRLFGFSVLYLFLLFAALVASHSNRWSTTLSTRRCDYRIAEICIVPRQVLAARSAVEIRIEEV
jgi:protoheme IX farnesyltransferase